VAIALIVLLGFFGMAANPVLIGMAVRYADRARTLASALRTASFNAGTAVGSWIAGFAIASTLGPTGPVLVGTCVAALYFLPSGVLFTMERRSARGRTRDREGGDRADGERSPADADQESGGSGAPERTASGRWRRRPNRASGSGGSSCAAFRRVTSSVPPRIPCAWRGSQPRRADPDPPPAEG
jgi:DHA1 family inner membrane transport protein